MTLVKPVIPAALFILLDDSVPGYAALCETAHSLTESKSRDALTHLRKAVVLQTQAIDSFCADNFPYRPALLVLRKRLLAIHLLEALYYIKVNNLSEAKAAYANAFSLSEKIQTDEAAMLETLEAMGTVAVLTQMLERKLSRYRPSCF